MPPPASTAPSVPATQSRVVSSLGSLAVAYLDAMTANDWARAGAILVAFTSVYNAQRGALIAVAANGAVNPAQAAVQFPPTIAAMYDVRSRQALAAVLTTAAAPGNTAQQLAPWVQTLDAMPQVAVSLGQWWSAASTQAHQFLLSSWWNLSRLIASAPLPDVAQLTSQQMQWVATGAGEFVTHAEPTPFDSPNASPASTPTTATPRPQLTALPPQQVTGTVPRFTMPVWGWWAIGIGGIAGAGVLAYGILEQGWLDTKGRKRSRRRR